MQIRFDEKQGVSICRISGNIDINTSPDVKKYFESVIKMKKPKVIISFADVSYIDSSGLATLVEILKLMRGYGGKLRLTNFSQKVLGLFEITKLNKLFDIHPDETAALSNF